MPPEVISCTALSEAAPTQSTIPTHLATVDGEHAVAVMRTVGDMQIHVSMDLDGQIDAPRMARALRLAMDAEPVLGCKLIRKPFRWFPQWQRRDDLEDIALCTLVHTEDIDEEYQAFLVAPHDPKKDPLVQVRIFRHPEGWDRMCFKISHVIADAGGSKQVAYLLASLYRKLGDQPDLQVDANLQGDRSYAQIIGRLSFTQKLQILRRALQDLKTRMFPLKAIQLKTPLTPTTRRRYAFRHIGSDQGQALKEFGRQHDATVNDVCLAALARGIHSYLDASPGTGIRLQGTVDLRRHLPQKKAGAICNLSSFMYIGLGTELGPDFAATLHKTRDVMNQLKPDNLGLGDALPLHYFARITPPRMLTPFFSRIMRAIYFLMPPCFTNMGRIDDTQLSFGHLDVENAWLTASVLYPPFLAGGISGFRSKLTFSLGFCEASFPRHKAEELLQAICTELPE